MMGLWGYANQLIAVIAVIAVLEDAVEEPLGGQTKKETFGNVEKGCWRVTGDGSFKLFICKVGFVLLSKTPSHQILSCFVSELPQCSYSWTFPRALSAEVELKKLTDETQPFPGNILA